MVISAPVDSDLLNAENWTKTNHLMYDSTYLDGKFGAWLEGNVVGGIKGKMYDVLRVDVPTGSQEYAALVEINENGKSVTFDKSKGFVEFAGGSKKFTIRYDDKTKLYWTFSNIVLPEYKNMNPSGVRNTLALRSSFDLKTWITNMIVLQHPDPLLHAFQYVDWVFDREDIIFLSRTAYDDKTGGAKNAHNANYLTFHRISNFRDNVKL